METTPEPDLTQSARFTAALRSYLFHENLQCRWLFTDKASEVLNKIWNDCADSLPESAPKVSGELGVEEIAYLGGCMVRIVGLPTPSRGAESYFVAVAYRPERKSWWPWRRRSEVLRYLTLEHGVQSDGLPRTVLGEWTASGHLSLGDGPDPSVDSFRRTLHRLLRGSRKPEGAGSSPGDAVR